MVNPITGKRTYFLAYTIVWITATLIQAMVDFYVFNTSLVFAVTDSIVFNFLFFILGIAMWFPVRYMSFNQKRVIPAVFSHLFLGMIILGIWMGTSFVILGTFSGKDRIFLENSIPFRAVIGALVLILIMLIYYLIVYSENLKLKISNESSLKTLVREAELSALKAQINPHFLFNSLNSISALTIRDPAAARKMIIELSEFLRYSLKYKEKEVTSLEDEIQNISRYLDIEKNRFEGKLIYHEDIPVECRNLFLPNMILQPLFENAIKHGVYESLDPVTITLSARCQDDFLLLEISNNFEGSLAPKKGAGIGLRNIGSRLKLIYSRDDLMKVQSMDGIFRVTLFIPVSQDK